MSESLGLSLRDAPFALGKATVLQAVDGADVSQAYAINKYGQSVGFAGLGLAGHRRARKGGAAARAA